MTRLRDRERERERERERKRERGRGESDRKREVHYLHVWEGVVLVTYISSSCCCWSAAAVERAVNPLASATQLAASLRM